MTPETIALPCQNFINYLMDSIAPRSLPPLLSPNCCWIGLSKLQISPYCFFNENSSMPFHDPHYKTLKFLAWNPHLYDFICSTLQPHLSACCPTTYIFPNTMLLSHSPCLLASWLPLPIHLVNHTLTLKKLSAITQVHVYLLDYLLYFT